MEAIFLNVSFIFLFRNFILRIFTLSVGKVSFCYKIIKNENYLLKTSRSFIYRASGYLIIVFIIRRKESGHFPLSSLYESLLFLGLVLVFFLSIFTKTNIPFFTIKFKYLIYRKIQLNKSFNPRNVYNKRFENLAISILSVVPIFVLGFASFCLPMDLQKRSPLIPALKSNWLFIHVTVIIASYAGLLIRSVFSIIFLLSYTKNSFKHTGKLFRFHETLDEIRYRLILFSYPLLTLGILSGSVWANEAWGSYWSWDPKETWALITWLIFTVYLHQRLFRVKNKTFLSLFAALGFIRVWISYLGVNLMGKGMHRYGWFLVLNSRLSL